MEIKTERLEIKAMGSSDLAALAQLLTDPVVGQTYMVPEFTQPGLAEAMAERLVALSQDPQRYIGGIFLDGQLIGMLNETDVSGDTMEVGYALLPRYYNRGYATEALRAVITDLFARGFCQVLAGAFEENLASLRVMEKSGMRKIERQEVIAYRGKDHRCLYYLAERS